MNLTRISRKFCTISQKFRSIKFNVDDKVASITLNRPQVFNAIDEHLPFELRSAVELANQHDKVKVLDWHFIAMHRA